MMVPKSEDGSSNNIRVRLLVGNDERIEDNTISGPTSFSRTCFNGLNALSGVGILAVPYALASGGWLSIIFLFIIAISTYYTSLLIQRCMDIDPTIASYPDIGERAFGSIGRMLVSTTMNVELYMVVTGFLILEGDNLQNLFEDIQVQLFGLATIGGKQFFVIIISLIILPTVWLNNMSILSYISASGVVASIVLLGSILWAAVFDGIGFQTNGTQFINWKGLPTAISLYAFCYCAHPVFPTLYTSMINPKKFSKESEPRLSISTHVTSTVSLKLVDLEAAYFGLCWCLYCGYTKIILELDSELSVSWIKHRIQTSWVNSQVLSIIHTIISQLQVVLCCHTYREANFIADCLAKHSHSITTPKIFFTASQLPRQAKAYYDLDKVSMASFRRRKSKRIKEPP